MTEYARRINEVRAIGTLDTQLLRTREKREETTIARRWNHLQGQAEQIALQVPSPYGIPFRLPLQLESPVEGRELLDAAAPGTLLAVVGELDWHTTFDARYALDPTERGRRTGDVIFRVNAIQTPTPADEPGCDCFLEGVVLTPARVLWHPEKRVRLALVTLRVQVERTRAGSRARMTEQAHVSVAIPVDHSDAPNLLRPGNHVIIEGMLERLMVLQHGEDVDRAIHALDAAWQQEQDALVSKGGQRREAERRYAKRRRQLLEAVRSRVVAGYVELVAGTPASVAESVALRRDSQRQRRADQQGRKTSAAVGTQETLVMPELTTMGQDEPPLLVPTNGQME